VKDVLKKVGVLYLAFSLLLPFACGLEILYGYHENYDLLAILLINSCLTLGLYFGNKVLGLIIALEIALTSFASYYSSMDYFSDGVANPDQAYIVYSMFIVAVQSVALVIMVVYKNPFIAFAYLINVTVNAISFFGASLLSLASESGSMVAIDNIISEIYWYVFWLSIVLIFAGLVRGSSGGNRATDNIKWSSSDQLPLRCESELQSAWYNQRFY